MSDLLAVRNLAIEFRLHDAVVRAVDGVSFRVRPGSTVALVGESGSGKSVISQAIMGILPPVGRIASGEILFADPKKDAAIDIAKLPADGEVMRRIRGGRISIIFQEPMTSLSPLHTIGNQICEALHLHRDVDKGEGREIAADMLHRVGFKDPKRALSIYPFELSGGLRQRAMIAMALVCRPALLIADEPTTALDVTIQAQILKLLIDLQRDLGMAILIITHDLGVVANMAEEVVVMYHGKIMEAGTRDDVFRDARHPYLKALLRAVPRFSMAPGERLMPLREITYAPEALSHLRSPQAAGGAPQMGEPLLSVRHVTKRFSIRKSSWIKAAPSATVLAVDDVSFDVRRGECLGLVGESGCGKTTLSKLLMRAITADSGEVLFAGLGKARNVFELTPEELTAYRRKVQFVFQDPFSSLNPRMTVFDIISEPLIIHGIGTSESRAEHVRELMRLVGLDVRFLNRYPHSFSGGQRQRIGIARALALQPDLLLLDEPVSALDVSIQAQILNFLKDLKKELGLTYIFISHNLAVVDYIADRIAVMCAGRLVEMAPRASLFRQPVHPYTRALLAAVPEPDPDRRLDLTMLMEGRASIPSAWPQPFTLDTGVPAAFIDLGDGHYVRAAATATRADLLRTAERVPA
jgi:peptide/nickel transport system ATP-binding protein